MEGTYNHAESEQIEAAANSVYEGISKLKDHLLHFELRLKDHITTDQLAKDISPILDHQTDALQYKKDLLNFSIKYNHIDISSIQKILPTDGIITDQIHQQVLDTIFKSFEETYGDIDEHSHPIIDKVAQVVVSLRNRRNERSQHTVSGEH